MPFVKGFVAPGKFLTYLIGQFDSVCIYEAPCTSATNFMIFYELPSAVFSDDTCKIHYYWISNTGTCNQYHVWSTNISLNPLLTSQTSHPSNWITFKGPFAKTTLCNGQLSKTTLFLLLFWSLPDLVQVDYLIWHSLEHWEKQGAQGSNKRWSGWRRWWVSWERIRVLVEAL